jgi:hypothetical protein
MRHARRGTILWGLVVSGLALWGCETGRNTGFQTDNTSPSISLTNTAGDTQDISGGLRFNVSALDNLSLKSVRLTFSGGLITLLDTVFHSQTKTYTVGRTITFPGNSGAGGNIMIVGRATDGAGNFAEDTLFIFLSNVQALRVTLVSPQAGALASQGGGIPVDIQAVQNTGISKIGFLVAPRTSVSDPTTPPIDSVVYTAPLADSVEFVDTLVVLPSSGTFNIIGFAEDSAGRRGFSNVVTVTIQSVANDVTKPTVAHKIAARVEVDDSITVRATDASPISWIGFRVDTSGVLLRFDTVNVAAGNLTDVTRRFSLGLAGLSPLPHAIVVKGYACDGAAARNCDYTNSTTLLPSAPVPFMGGPARSPQGLIDTVIVVNGITIPLPNGGRIADAIFNANLNELYLTNPVRQRVEIFQVATTSFVPGGIPAAASQPWGIALWPRDTLGNYGDSIVVADAGGTQLAVIDVRPGVRRLQWRQDLPNFLIETYHMLQIAGGVREEITGYDVSDRPQYVATVCRAAGGTACAPDSIYALYSTTPTVSSDNPFSGRATLRMEKLINTANPALMFGKLFWEIGATTNAAGTDTLRVELIRGNTSQVVLSACRGITVNLASFGLGDSTYARNSGNFTHAFFGEGGNISTQFARVMAYDARRPITGVGVLNNSCVGLAGRTIAAQGEDHVDFGMSPAVNVSDFISNTGINVHSIATNFNGLTNVVRADSLYYLDANLRLKATSCTLGSTSTACVTGTPGMDMNYDHDFAPGGSCTPSCGGSGNVNNRILFAARPDGNIDVFDTYHGLFLGSIAVRDPITGPLRVAKDATGQLLFGITNSGLVMIRLPTIVNPFPVRRPGGSP